MAVCFIEKHIDNCSFCAARIEGPNGGMPIDISPFETLECSVSHQTKGKAKGFGLLFTTGKTNRAIHVGTIGETEKFLRLIKSKLQNNWFWEQKLVKIQY
jgi:hypothetical protein